MTGQADSVAKRFAKFVRRRAIFNLALLARRRNRHTSYIAVTGSSAKSTTCSLLTHILQPVSPTTSRIFSNTMPAIARFMRTVTPAHDYAVIETGIDGLDRMRHLAKLIRPHIGIITMIGLEHRAQLRTREIVAREKSYLTEMLSKDGVALFNADDDMTESMAGRTNGKVVKFGREQPADYRAIDVSAELPKCLSLRIKGPQIDLDLQTQLIGEHFWLPVTAAVACAAHIGVPPEIITQQVASFTPPPGRCSVMPLPDDRLLVLDTYKAPQHSLKMSFDMMRTASAVHKRIVLGQISDGTGSSTSTYRRAYRFARESADEVIFVGEHAHRHNASQDDIANGRIREFRDVRDAADYLRNNPIAGELTLFKSNTKLHLERAALAQVETIKCWERKCGLKNHCSECEFYRAPRRNTSDG